MTRAAKRPWLAALLSLLMLVTMVAPSLAQPPAMTSEDAIRFLVEHKIVQGDEHGNLNLDKTITRAELAKVVVVAKRADNLVPILAPLVSFADSRGHWGAGYIEAAARLGLVRGRDANTFDPNAPITYAEALTVLLRMVGQEPLVWSPAAVMQRAAQLGIIEGGSLELLANLPIPRGVVFESLTRTMVRVPLPNGSTLAKELDADPPALTVSAPAATASDKVTVAGTATGAYAVTVNGTPATLVDGTFTAEVALNPGANTITVVAYDVAGNQTTKTVTVVRGGDVVAISVSGPTSVKAGESVKLTVRPTDAQGNVLPASVLTATVSDDMGTFDTATGRFTAGNKAGRATITFTASTGVTETYEIDVLGLAAEAAGLRIRESSIANGITVGRTGIVVVEVVDAEGNFLSYDDGRLVSLQVSGLPGVTVLTPSVRTEAGVATFQVRGTEVGEANLQATSSGLAAATGTLQIVSSIRVVLTADQTDVTADGIQTVRIRANLVDADGKAITNNTGADIYIDLDVPDFDGTVINPTLRIPRGASSSAGYDAQVVAGFRTETVKFGGIMRSSHSYSIIPVTIRFREIVIGPAARFDVTGGHGVWAPEAEVSLTVRVTDNNGNTVTTGSYAFQVKVSTSNDDGLAGGMPGGLHVYLGDTLLNPVQGADDAIVARTTNGTARLRLIYDKSGIVNLEVVGVKATDDAWDDNGLWDTASSGTHLTSAKREITFAATDVRGLRIRVDLPNSGLQNQPAGVLPNSSKGRAVVRVFLLDGPDISGGGWIPNASGTIKLERDTTGDTDGENSRISGKNEVTAKNGVAEFSVVALQEPGTDYYKATYTNKDGTNEVTATIPIRVYDRKLATPEIVNITGDKSGAENLVTVSDSSMRIHFTVADAGDSDYGFVKVYRSGSSTPIFISNVMELSGAPYIDVPKDKLRASDRYLIGVDNGFGEVKSLTWPLDLDQTVIVAKESTATITGVSFDADHKVNGVPVSRLYVTAKGVVSGGAIDPSKLTLRQTVTGQEWPLHYYGAECTPGNGSFTCILYTTFDPKEFNGSVILDTEEGWFTRASTGEIAPKDSNIADNRVTPTAYITHAGISFKGGNSAVLNLYGINLTQGSLNIGKIRAVLPDGDDQDDDPDLYPIATGTPSRSATKISVTVPATTVQKILQAKDNDEKITLNAEAGWLYTSSSFDNAAITGIPVLVEPNILSVAYSKDGTVTITGSGFEDATINVLALRFEDVRREAYDDLNGALDGTTTFKIESDTLITIKLSPTLNSKIQEKGSGKVYLTSVSDPSVSWFVDKNGWLGTPLPRTLLTWKP